jgi:phosphatidylserine decarboxylase
MVIDRAGLPFVAVAALPAIAIAWWAGPWWGLPFGLLPLAIGAFFRDPDRTSPQEPGLVLSPADARVLRVGAAEPPAAPPGDWRQITMFLSPLDVHINRTPVSGRVTRVEYHPGSFRPAYHHDAALNERSEIWFEHRGQVVIARQVVGAMARRVVCRLHVGDEVEAGQRLGLMKFGSRMDVFVPLSARIAVVEGQCVVAGETILARLALGANVSADG